MKDQRTDQGHRSDQAHQRNGHNLNRDTGLHTVEHVLAGVFAITKVAGCGDCENRHRFFDQLCAITAEHLLHLDHARNAVLGEGTRNHRFLRRRQGHVETPRIRNL